MSSLNKLEQAVNELMKVPACDIDQDFYDRVRRAINRLVRIKKQAMWALDTEINDD